MKGDTDMKRKKIILIVVIALAICLFGAAVFFAVRFFKGTTGPIGTYSSTRTAVKLMWDVPASNPDYAAISASVKYGVIRCSSDGAFRPSDKVLRAEFASMITRAIGLEEVAPVYSAYYDLTPDNPYYGFVEPASPYLTGYEDKNGKYYKPNDAVIRSDAAAAIIKAGGIDLKSADPMATCLKNGWLRLVNGASDPSGTITRADAALLLKGFVESRMPKPTGTSGISSIH
jgi:hypothetical protein